MKKQRGNWPRLLATLAVLYLPATGIAQKPATLNPKVVRVIKATNRDDARVFAQGGQTEDDWGSLGIPRVTERTTPAKIRDAFQGNAINAERRFSKPFAIFGELHSVRRRNDGKIVVVYKDGGLAASQRRSLRGLTPPGYDPGEMMSGLTGGVLYPGATAVLDPVHEDIVAAWKPGQEVVLRCDKATNVNLAVMLDGCVPLESV